MTGQDLINLIIEKGLTQERIDTCEIPVIPFCVNTLENADDQKIFGQQLVLETLYDCTDGNLSIAHKPGDIIFLKRTPNTADFLDEEMEYEYDDCDVYVKEEYHCPPQN